MSAASNVAMEFLLTLKDYPPSQTPGSFNLDTARKRIEAMSKTEN
jgi:arylsulfatase